MPGAGEVVWDSIWDEPFLNFNQAMTDDMVQRIAQQIEQEAALATSPAPADEVRETPFGQATNQFVAQHTPDGLLVTFEDLPAAPAAPAAPEVRDEATMPEWSIDKDGDLIWDDDTEGEHIMRFGADVQGWVTDEAWEALLSLVRRGLTVKHLVDRLNEVPGG